MNLDLREVFMSCDSHGVSPDAIMLPKVESVEHVAEVRVFRIINKLQYWYVDFMYDVVVSQLLSRFYWYICMDYC